MVQRIVLFVLFAVALTIAGTASARDTRHMFSYEDAMTTEGAKSRLDGSIKFYFGKESHPPVARSHGEFMSNKKTNAFNKSDKQACEWAFLSAMISLQDRAKSLGADAVINIKSYYKKNLVESNTEYECGAGGILAGVTLKGTVVKFK